MQHNRKCILEEVVQSRIIVSCDVIANWKDPVSLSKKEIGKEFGWLYYFVLSASPLFSAWSISNKNCYRFQSTVSFGIYFFNVFWSSNRRLAIPSFYDGSIFYRSPILFTKKRKWREKLYISVRRFQAETYMARLDSLSLTKRQQTKGIRCSQTFAPNCFHVLRGNGNFFRPFPKN